MADFLSIEDVAGAIKSKLDDQRILALYAFNSTGKTRLSNVLSGLNEDWNETEEDEGENDTIKTLCYNAFIEDMFVWNNEHYILTFDPRSWIIQLVVEQGLEAKIIDNFKDIINSNWLKLEPSFDFIAWAVTFKIASGDDASETNIKISKGEESMLIWSIFYTVLQTAISELNTLEADRTTPIFNELQYIIIDDPVSSIDDTKIITMAIKLIEAIKLYKGNTVKILITTHHALFYNILVNSFKWKGSVNLKHYSLSRDKHVFRLVKQGDSPFSYHLSLKETIQTAIANDSVEKYHFNLFRALLEKTANFFGYHNWADCIIWANKEEFIRLLNLYSHSRLSDIESSILSIWDKTIFQESFNDFIVRFNWQWKNMSDENINFISQSDTNTSKEGEITKNKHKYVKVFNKILDFIKNFIKIHLFIF